MFDDLPPMFTITGTASPQAPSHALFALFRTHVCRQLLPFVIRGVSLRSSLRVEHSSKSTQTSITNSVSAGLRQYPRRVLRTKVLDSIGRSDEHEFSSANSLLFR